jgi:bifunctional UDP-N-acetylglucosamine pyrophosphorylase/glucosamine-1-phosphate N-acetyltransferase
MHTLLGRPMVSYPVQAALDAGAEHVAVVVGHGREQVQAELEARFGEPVRCAVQEQQRGTGDAARCGQAAVGDFDGWLVILNGDIPLLTAEAVGQLVARAEQGGGDLALLTATVDDAAGYGRILRDDAGRVRAIREDRDCSEAEREIREFNPGVYCIRAGFFRERIGALGTENAQGELYLTDLVELAAGSSDGAGVADLPWPVADLHGVNDRGELVQRERDLRRRQARALSRAGVTLRDPDSAFIDADVEIAADVEIGPGVHLRGKTRIEEGAFVDAGCVLSDCVVRARAHLKPYTVASESEIGARAEVGPFSHLRPGSALSEEVHVGNFVETKKTSMGPGSKANHLAYLGDGVVGAKVNVGAGTIFCNYDGFAKHRTVLEDGAFIGSDSQLVAPVTVGRDAYVATGTTVTADVPADALAIGRARQQNKEGLGKRMREKLRAQAERKKAERGKAERAGEK